MRIKIPLTGTVLDFDPKLAALDGCGISGDPDDPIRVINLNIGNISSKLVSIDIENDEMEIEISPGRFIDEPDIDASGKQKEDTKGELLWNSREATPGEKQQFLDNAKQIVESKTKDELYTATGSARLKKPSKVMTKYRAYKKE